MATTARFHSDALVALTAPASAIPLDARILDAKADIEAAEHFWRMAAQRLARESSQDAAEMRQAAAEMLRDALDTYEALLTAR